MAANTATLFFNKFDNYEKGRPLASYGIRFYQATDEDGQLASVVRGGKITMKMRASHLEDVKLWTWMVDNEEKTEDKGITGRIIFQDSQGIIINEIGFFGAHCVDYVEYWEDKEIATGTDRADFSLSHWVEISITCQWISNEGATPFRNNWNLQESNYKGYS